MSGLYSFPRQLLVVCVSLLVLAALLSGCGNSITPMTTVTTTGSTGPTGTTGSTSKPVLKGLVTQGPSVLNTPPANNFEELNAHPGVYSAAVIQATWAQLEPSQGVFDDSVITTALAKLATYNNSNSGAPVVGKLRVFAGVGTPQWVINATGAVTVTTSNGTGTAGEFWTPQYRTFWQGLQNHLAAVFDTNAMIGEVAITSCSTLTAEPFIIPNNTSAIATLHAAGYTDALGMACLSNAPADYAAWTQTPLDYTFNTFSATDSGFAVANATFPMQLMASFRTSLGLRAVVANHGLQTVLTTDASTVYPEFTALYTQAAAATPATISPLEFQTYSPSVDWPSTIALGLTYHPTEIEIWDTTSAGGSAPLTQAQLSGWAAMLK